MQRLRNIEVPADKMAVFCRRHGIRKLAFFGSVLGDDFRPASDVDVLVEFQPGVSVGRIGLAGLQLELGDLLGRPVDMRTPQDLSPCFRDEAVRAALVQYARG